MEPTLCSETSAFNTQTPEKYPEYNLSLQQHGERLKTRIHDMCSHVTLQASPGKVFEGAQFVTKEGTNLIIQKHLRNLVTQQNITISCMGYEFNLKLN
jgi:hypothetical protein